MLSELEQEHYDWMLPIARHEFGHYAVARHVGFKTYGISIAAKEAFYGPGGQAEIGMIRGLRGVTDIRTFCEDRVKVLSAGVLAEAMDEGVIANDDAILYCKSSGQSDFAKAREHLRILHNLDHPDNIDDQQAEIEINAIYNRLWDEATMLVTKYAEFIVGMADELAKKEAVAFVNPEFTEAELSRHPLVLMHFP